MQASSVSAAVEINLDTLVRGVALSAYPVFTSIWRTRRILGANTGERVWLVDDLADYHDAVSTWPP